MDASGENIKGWEKVRILANVVASVLIPLVIVWVTSIYSSSQKEKDLNARYIELAIDILRDDPNPSSEQIRNWAIDIINLYSEVKISDSARNQLLKNRIFLVPKDAKEFQSEAGLAPDEIVGPATIRRLNQEVRRLLEQDEKNEAIILVRRVLGFGQKEAKKYVEGLYSEEQKLN